MGIPLHECPPAGRLLLDFAAWDTHRTLPLTRLVSPAAAQTQSLRRTAIGDHVRLPARFFARLFASDGSRLAR